MSVAYSPFSSFVYPHRLVVNRYSEMISYSERCAFNIVNKVRIVEIISRMGSVLLQIIYCLLTYHATMLSVKHRLIISTSAIILIFGTFMPTLVYAAPLQDPAKDWQTVNGNSWAWNSSPQIQIIQGILSSLILLGKSTILLTPQMQ